MLMLRKIFACVFYKIKHFQTRLDAVFYATKYEPLGQAANFCPKQRGSAVYIRLSGIVSDLRAAKASSKIQRFAIKIFLGYNTRRSGKGR
jgi:hypothetical protein